MKNIIIIILTISALSAFGQRHQNWQWSLQLQPEYTYHQSRYPHRWNDRSTKTTFNLGFATAVQYNVTRRLFVNLGAGYISRKLNTSAILDQAALPPPHYSATKELNTIRYITYNTLQVPVNVGFRFIENPVYKIFLTGGVAANYLLSTYYKTGRPQYDGTYHKGYWQGLSVNGGIGAEWHLFKSLWLTNTLDYSLSQSVRRDDFLRGQGSKTIGLPHKYLRWSIGVTTAL